ncbi:MAG: Ni/Fe-hydrogenase cytochrome b subunit [Vibrio sp.]
MSDEAKPLGGRLINRTILFLAPFIALCVFVILKRLFFGIGEVANLNGGYPWGLWISFDLLTGTGLACGGWALAWAVYIFNKGEYHPLVRPALLASLFGYALGGFSITMDVGRWWNIPYFFFPNHINTGSVLFETAACMTIYISIVAIEFAPVLLEKIGFKKILKWLNKFMFIFIAIGALLPTMHQSSMGSLFIVAGHKIHPIWQSYEMLPLFSVLTAFMLGFSIVVFEGSIFQASMRGRSPDETKLFYRLSFVTEAILAIFLVLRFGELIYHGKLHYIFAMDFYAKVFWVEVSFMVLPLIIFRMKQLRQDSRALLIAALSMIFAGAMWRIDLSLIAFDPGEGYRYFPSIQESLMTLGLVAIEVAGYIFIVKLLPVLPAIELVHKQHIDTQSQKEGLKTP